MAFNKFRLFIKLLRGGESRVEALNMADLQNRLIAFGDFDQGIRFLKGRGKGFLNQCVEAVL